MTVSDSGEADQSERPSSVLAVMAHPDDAELWAGGTLALHARAAAVTVAVGSAEPARLAEAEAGAAILGASLRVIDRPASVEEILALIVELRPDVVVTHPSTDVHPYHRHIAETVLAALPRAVIASGRPRRVYATDTYNSLTLHGPVQATAIVDVTAAFTTKMRALDAHAGTQPIAEEFGPMAENLARLWGARIGVPYAEAFTAVPVLGRLPAARGL